MKTLEDLAQVDRTNRISDFGQFCRLLMLSRGQASDAIPLAKGRASQRVLDLLEKAAVLPGGGGGAGTWADQLTSPVLRAFVESLRFSSAFAAAANANLLVKVPIGDAVGVVMAGASDAAEAGASDAIPVRNLAVSRTTTARRKTGGMIVLSNEFLRQAPQAAESTISRELRGAVASGVDSAFVTTITTGVTPHTSLGTALDDGRMLLEDVDLTTMSRPFWLAGVNAAIRLATQHASGVRYAPDLGPLGGTFMTFPLYVSAGADPWQLILADGARIAGNLAEVDVAYSAQALVQSDDAPAGGLAGSPSALNALGTHGVDQLVAGGLLGAQGRAVLRRFRAALRRGRERDAGRLAVSMNEEAWVR
jgi:hypothetical protein